MNTLTAQEAALYLGQEFETYTLAKGTPCGVEILGFGNLYKVAFSGSYCKLYLRPLSDITEEEAIIAFQWEQLSAREWDTLLKMAKSGMLKYSPTEFTYLLSRGFDLFGHLESGKAISKCATGIEAAPTEGKV